MMLTLACKVVAQRWFMNERMSLAFTALQGRIILTDFDSWSIAVWAYLLTSLRKRSGCYQADI
jgi:hypothetical protein